MIFFLQKKINPIGLRKTIGEKNLNLINLNIFVVQLLKSDAMDLLKEFWEYMKERKKWWLIPVFIVFVIFGLLIILSSGSALAPFIYTLF
jgi:hypothetical protein